MRDDERELYRLHAKLPVHRRRVEAAQAIVRRAVSEHPGTWAVSMSGGKDSTALLDIAISAGWAGPVFHFWSQETPPENTALVLAQAGRSGLPVISTRVRGDWDAWDRLGEAVVLAQTAAQRAVLRESNRAYKVDANAAACAAGLCGLFWGMRADESRIRAIVVRRKGPIYRNRVRGTVTALPLAHWSARDVWARHVTQGLPWLARYDHAQDRERERSEPVWMGFEEPWRRGQGAELHRTDPALWARVTARWPELSRYG